MKKMMMLVAAAVAALMVSACCGSQPDLAGKWIVETIGDRQLAGQEIPGMEELPFLEFNVEEGRVHGNAGINIVNSDFKQDGESLEFGLAATTMMAGPEEAMNIERSFLDAFGRVASAKVSKDAVLELSDAEGVVVMTLKRQE